MSQLKGYRTILFNVTIGIVTLLGLHVAPDAINHWLDVIIPATVVGNILLRALTDTPMFNALAAKQGLSPAAIADIKSAVASLPAGADLPAAVNDLTDKVNALAGHPIFDPGITKTLATLAAQQVSTTATPALGPSPVATAAS